MWVAVIGADRPSERPDDLIDAMRGEWSCFVDVSKEAAIKIALRVKRRWEARSGKEYEIWVGELTHSVKEPSRWRLVSVKR